MLLPRLSPITRVLFPSSILFSSRHSRSFAALRGGPTRYLQPAIDSTSAFRPSYLHIVIMMPGPRLKFRSIFHSLCKRLYVTWCQHKNPSTFTLFETGDEIEADIPGSLCSQAAVAAKCHHFHFAFDELDNKVSRFPDSPIVIPSSPPKGLLKPTSPTVTIEATEVRSESFSDEDLEGLYDRELEHIGPDLVPRMRTAEVRVLTVETATNILTNILCSLGAPVDLRRR